MAGEGDSTRNKKSSPSSSRQSPDDENPFDAFRRFADEQISSMLHSVIGLPSFVTPPQSERWAIFADEQEYRDAQLRQRREHSDEDERGELSSNVGAREAPSPPDNSFPLGPSRLRRSRPENLFDIDMFFDSFFDRFWLDDHVSSRFFHPYHRPAFSSMMSADSPTWPVNYLMFSPYSPLHLERQARYRSHSESGVFSSLTSSLSLSSGYEHEEQEPRWREAFEDLLRLENGKPMLDREREQGAVAKPESGREWLQGLVKRGSLGDHWKYAAGSENQPWSTVTLDRPGRSGGDGRYLPEEEKLDTPLKKTDEAESEPMTELDLYDRFLADIEAREQEFFGGFHHSPLLRFLLDDRRRGSNGILPSERERDYQSDDTESWSELVAGGNKNSVPDSPKKLTQRSTTDLGTPATSPAEEPYVVSTQISTERVRLPDGSIQTKTMKTKRFADGREETNESTEVVNPPQRNQNANQQGATPEQKRNGWFWKD